MTLTDEVTSAMSCSNAYCNNSQVVIVPADNEPDLDEIDPTVKSALNFVLADKVDKVLDIALLPKTDEPKVEAKSPRTAKKTRSDIRQ